MRWSPLWRAITVAAFTYVGQIFLQSAAIVLLTAILLLTAWNPTALVLGAVAVFYAFVGLMAIQQAVKAISGLPPLR